MEWFADNSWLGWVGVAIILAAIEVATVDFVFIMLAGGALAGALVAAAGASFAVQVIVAIVVATLLIVLVRPLIKRKFMDSEVSHRIGASGLVGRVARVLQTVTETDGRVKLGGETWSARVPDGAAICQPGQEVRVIAIEGATAIVIGDAGAQETE
jgi:membrane protein implicated in regulation of membrane protease activity